MRVVSLLPSATEIVACIGGESTLVGRSHECSFPPGVTRLPALTAAKTSFENSRQMNDAVTETLKSGTGLYTVDADRLRELDPDVIVTQSVCAVCSVDYEIVKKLAKTMTRHPTIVDLNPQSLEEVLEGCKLVGNALGLEDDAASVMESLKQRVEDATAIAQQFPLTQKPKVWSRWSCRWSVMRSANAGCLFGMGGSNFCGRSLDTPADSYGRSISSTQSTKVTLLYTIFLAAAAQCSGDPEVLWHRTQYPMKISATPIQTGSSSVLVDSTSKRLRKKCSRS